MSISQDSGAVIVCREVFDEDSRPSKEEIVEYAKRLGIDPDAEPHLLDLACAGLMAPLPKGWSPCLDEATGAWYYYQASTRTTTWEHPLDARHRALVERERARAPPGQLTRLDDDAKIMAKEFDCQEEGNFSKDIPQSKVPVAMTKIPTKLAPLSRKATPEPIGRRMDSGTSRHHRRTSATDTSRSENLSSSLMTDRAARDYSNVIFQDPKFYETPRLLDSPERQMRLKEIVTRSESMSPRYEKDWEQLSRKFSSADNVIDIDKLSTSSLTHFDAVSSPTKFESERNERRGSEQKELTLSGGGTMFLKSNRTKEKSEQAQSTTAECSKAAEGTNGNETNWPSEKPKSILREKVTDDEERPLDEERKSVRFDLERDPMDIKFTFSAFGDDVEDAGDNLDSEGSGDFQVKDRESFFSSLRRADTKPHGVSASGLAWISDVNPSGQDSDVEEKHVDADDNVTVQKDSVSWTAGDEENNSSDRIIRNNKVSDNGTNLGIHPDPNSECTELTSKEINKNNVESVKESELSDEGRLSKRTQVIGRRFVVENVSEKEHLNQLSSVESNDIDRDYLPKNKFGNVRNIDLFSKSETDSTAGRSCIYGDSKSSLLDEIRKNKELMLESMKRTDQRIKRDKQKERDQVYHIVKLRHDLEAVNQERGRLSHQNFDDVKTVMSKRQDDRVPINFKREFDTSLDRSKREIEANFEEEKLKLQRDFEKRLNEFKVDLAKKEEEEIKKLVAEMDELRMENLKKVRHELEICYEKERQDILENLKTELDQRKRELLDLRNQEMEKLQSEHDKGLAKEKISLLTEHEVRKQHNEKIEAMKRELEKEFDDLRNALRTEQREKVTKITEDHEKCLAEILRDFRVDEGVARKVYKQRLEEIRSDFSRDTETEVKKQAERVSRQETVDFEKIRCEKRLLEDKYKTLKDKYSKLKNDVRLAVERRSKRKEGNTTTSETEKSTSARTRTERTERTDPSDQKASPTNTRSNPSANTGFGRTQSAASGTNNQHQTHSATEDSEGGQRSTTGFHRSGVAHGDCSSRSSAKFESDDTTTASETVNSNVLKNKRKSFARRSTSSVKQQSLNNNNVDGSDNPVENIRKQLEKLEDLGDHLPSNESAYTLRYPFQDKAPANASSELEFFRHRIHVERDSVKRAREALKVQRSAFQSRQRAWKQRSARTSLEQLVQEERELSDMEVSLHRTRSLLGEKVIYLRHLEQSLERVANAKRNESETIPLKNDEMTLSDMSSASSGFSSTDLGTDTFIDKPDHYQESTEIIASLENLNSEIREIWGVLNKRQDNNIPPPPTLMYSDLGWLPFQHLTTQSSNVQGFATPNIQSNILSQLTTGHPPTTTTQNIIAQYGPNSGFTTSVGTVDRGASSLIERTRHMRDWLRQARLESTDLISPAQATL